VEILLGESLFDAEFLVGGGESFVVVDDLVEFLLLLLDVGLDVVQFVVGVFFDGPFYLGQHFCGLSPADQRVLELAAQGDELHLLVAVLFDLAQ
jgi:hypothetical protein